MNSQKNRIKGPYKNTDSLEDKSGVYIIIDKTKSGDK